MRAMNVTDNTKYKTIFANWNPLSGIRAMNIRKNCLLSAWNKIQSVVRATFSCETEGLQYFNI